jgi:uncharacterized protein YjbI with pentapeptide repeats
MADEIDLQAALSGDNDLAQRDLKNADFSGKNFSNRNFDGAYLSSANFSNATLTNSTFHQANTLGLIAVGADANNMKANRTVFFNCNFQDSDFSDSDFSSSHFQRTEFSRSKLRGVNFRNCKFNEGNLFEGATSDETTMFDGATILRSLARDPVFRFYSVERGKLVRLPPESVVSETVEPSSPSPSDVVNAIESAKTALLRAASFEFSNTPQSPGIGHNGPPVDLALVAEEVTETIGALGELKQQFTDTNPQAGEVQKALITVAQTQSKIASWAAKKLDIFSDEFVKSVGQELGKTKTWVALWLLVSGQMAMLLELISKFFG